MKEVFMIIMTLFLLVGMTNSVNALEKIAPLPSNKKITTSVDIKKDFLLIPSNNFSEYYLDTSRIIKYVNSNLLDGWVKKVMTEQGRAIEMQQMQQIKKIKKIKPPIEDKQKAKMNERLSKLTSYQLIHQQFDPINLKYKILEVYSYNVNSQLLSSTINESSWVTIPADSIEEKTLLSINDYIQNGVDKVLFK